jgi:diguanylate cyclase (GGDEF)-like protein
MSAIGLTLAALLGGVAGWALGRRPGAPRLAPGVGPHLLPDPALEWLRRSHGALGVWLAELDPGEEGPRAERLVDAERLSIAQITAVDRRLERARDQEQSGAERLEGGTLVFHASAGSAVGLLLPDGLDAGRLELVERDLQRLLDGMRRRPQLMELTQARTHEVPLESVASVGLRLAYQLGRILDEQAVVVVNESAGESVVAGTARREASVRVIGVSGRGDRRLLDALLPPESRLARVAMGESEQELAEGDPLGGVVADRRQRAGAVWLVPIKAGFQTTGAVAIWPPGGKEPTGSVRAEIMEALASAGPRLVVGLEADRRKAQASVDPLTGIGNRRGLDAVLNRQNAGNGTLIFADLDRFKLLNDTLGHPAGDAALVHFSRIIREQIRGGDLPARIGGEEFAVWLPGAGLEVGAMIAERIRVKLATTSWAWQGRNWPLSASFGVAACPETSRTLSYLAAQADAALYVAKNSGRDRVEIAEREGQTARRADRQ